MRVLLVHPEDSPTAGEWSASRFDLVVDLGWAGTTQYAVWTEEVGCPVYGLCSRSEWHEGVRRLRELCAAGSGCLVDEEGIDWWELLAPDCFQGVYEFLLLLRISSEIQSPVEVRVTRQHGLADTLGKLLGVKVVPFIKRAGPFSARVHRYTKAFRKLSRAQIIAIALDKWDTDYRFRRLLHGRRRSSPEPKILLPSAYRNVSRVLAAYARLLPERRFLMVTTRADGRIANLPGNVDAAPLAAYVPVPQKQATEREIDALIGRWGALRTRLQQPTNRDPVTSYSVDLFPDFERSLRMGLRIRDAWREVLEKEQIVSVLCGDEHNPYTRLPVLLARGRGLRTVHCTHGALDVNLLLCGVCSDFYLAKGEMEKDYMVDQCGVPEDRIVLGAPLAEHSLSSAPSLPWRESRATGGQIVFFSEPYELNSGRTESLYREVLPGLCAIARQYGRKVVLKLHPFEEASDRSRLIDGILTGDDRQLVEISTAPISEKLLRGIWFALTVESSVAVECALAGIPCFLCGWFDLDTQCYGRQYEKFGAARILTSPSAIPHIPEMVDPFGCADYRSLWQPIAPVKLDEMLQSAEVVTVPSASNP